MSDVSAAAVPLLLHCRYVEFVLAVREQEEDPCPQRRRTEAGPLLRVEEEGTSVYEHRAKGNEDVHEGLSGRLRGLLFSGRVDGMGTLHERWNRRTYSW